MKRVVIVHRRVWKIPKNQQKSCLEAVERAAQLAMNCLLNHNSVLDAVEVAVRCMEQSSLRRWCRLCSECGGRNRIGRSYHGRQNTEHARLDI